MNPSPAEPARAFSNPQLRCFLAAVAFIAVASFQFHERASPALSVASPVDTASIEGVPGVVRPLLVAAATDPLRLTTDVAAALPFACLILFPFFAFMLAAFFHGRPFRDHWRVTLDVHAVLFASLAASTALGLVSDTLGSLASLVALVWVAMYFHRALARMYAAPQVSIWAREFGVGIVYGIASVPVIAGLAVWVA